MKIFDLQFLKYYFARVNWLKVEFLSIGASVVSAVLSSFTENGLDLYMSIAFPFFVIYFLMFMLCDMVKGSFSFTVSSVFLILLGVTLQVILSCTSSENAAVFVNSLFWHSLVGIVLGIIGGVGIHLLCKVKRTKIYILLVGATLIMYAVLLVFGVASSGTKAWITIFGFTFQLTEICKVFAIGLIALLLTDEKLKNNQKVLFSTLTVVLHAVFLMMVSELGTLAVISITYIILSLFFLERKALKSFIKALAFIALLASIFLFVCYACSKFGGNTGLVNTFGMIFEKLSSRFSVFAGESTDIYGKAYQTYKMKETLSMAEWFGGSYQPKIPVIESDFIVLQLISSFGIVSFFVLMLAIIIFFISGVCSLNCTDSTSGSLAIGFNVSIIITALLSASSAIGVLPVIGVGFPFLARGGTALALNIAMVVFCLIATTEVIFKKPNNSNEREPICRR